MVFFRVAAALALVALTPVPAARAQTAEYRLGPQDQLKIKVFDLRSGTGEAYQWTAFEGEFTVSAAGRVALPLVGELEASGKTTLDLARAVSAGLQAKVGLAVKPDASVQIFKYRPFYVSGAVAKPGEFEFRPALTVLQAVSLAGGLDRVTGDALLGYLREAVTTRGDLRTLFAARDGFLARQARLDAEIKGSGTVAFPAELQARAADPDVARMLREEQLLFDARRMDITSQTAAFASAKVVLQQEIASLDSKDAALGRQLDAVRRELQQITGLVSKGLTVLPRQLEMEQTTAQFESNRLDVALNRLRAQQDLSKNDRDLLQLQNERRSQALQEATEVHAKLAETSERIVTAQRLVTTAEGRMPAVMAADASARREPDYIITRRVDGVVKDLPSKGEDPVQPGDVLRVEPNRRDSGLDAAIASAGTESLPPPSN